MNAGGLWSYLHFAWTAENMFPWPLYGLSLDLIDGAVGVIDELLNPRDNCRHKMEWCFKV